MLSFMSGAGGGIMHTVTVTESKTKNVYPRLASVKQKIADMQCEIANKIQMYLFQNQMKIFVELLILKFSCHRI